MNRTLLVTTPRLALAGAAVILALAVAVLVTRLTGRQGAVAVEEQDRVVGVDVVCMVGFYGWPEFFPQKGGAHELWGRSCTDQFPKALSEDLSVGSATGATDASIAINRRKRVTVRSTGGDSHRVEVPLTTPVKVGDPWP